MRKQRFILVHDPDARTKELPLSTTVSRALKESKLKREVSTPGEPREIVKPAIAAKRVQPASARYYTISEQVLTVAEARVPKQVQIGLWDIGAWLGGLQRVIEQVNASQSVFVFYEVKAQVPVGLLSTPAQIIPWFRDRLGRKPTAKEIREMADNLIANEFYDLGDRVRHDLELDQLVGITPSMVAGEESDGGIYWNHFSTCRSGTIVVSAYDLREFAAEAGRSFEALLMGLVFTQVLVNRFPKLDFHKDRGCLFDYDGSRTGIIEKARAPRIEPSCMRLISKDYQPAVRSVLEVLIKL